MAGISKLILLFLIAFSATWMSSNAQTCSNYTFFDNRAFASCSDLPVLNSFLHYNYDSSTRNLQIAYRHTGVSPSQWVAWAVNPTSTGMVGSQALIAYQQTNGTMRAYTSPITSYGAQLEEADLSVSVSDLTAIYNANDNEMIIFATLGGIEPNSTLNQVWQDGPLLDNTPRMHPLAGPNVQSMATINIVSGTQTLGSGKPNSRIKKRNNHGVLNIASWGILMPIGVMLARYLKTFKSANPTWFYLHVACQLLAYAIGVAGWGTGLHLGTKSSGIKHSAHKNIGIAIFSLATLQLFALFLRPKPDNKLRPYWNWYHRAVGYTVIALSIVNIFKGFDILNPKKLWRNTYIGVIAALAFVAVLFEAFKVVVVLKRKRSEPDVINSDIVTVPERV